MRILLIILSFLIFRQSASVCAQALSSGGQVSSIQSDSDDVECSKTLFGHSCCDKKGENKSKDDNSDNHHHKCKCLTSMASFVLLNKQALEISYINEITFNPLGIGYQHMFSTDIFQKISNPPQA
jgi:hypothetical protein